MTRAEGGFTVFGSIGVMPGQTGSNQKGEGAEKERKRYVNSDLVHPCNPASFHIADYSVNLAHSTMIINISLQRIIHIMLVCHLDQTKNMEKYFNCISIMTFQNFHSI